MDKEIFDVLKRIENTFIEKFDKLEEGQQALNTKLEETYQIVEAFLKDINNVEIITSSNWHDIAKLKAIK